VSPEQKDREFFQEYPGIIAVLRAATRNKEKMDLSQLFGSQPGLLTDTDQGNANQAGLMAAAAALLKASGPSPYKAGMTTLPALGEALAGGLAARQASTTDTLKNKLLSQELSQRANSQVLAAVQAANQYQALGLPIPPAVQKIIAAAGANLPPAPNSPGASLPLPPAAPNSPAAASPSGSQSPSAPGTVLAQPSQPSTVQPPQPAAPWPVAGSSAPGASAATPGSQNAPTGLPAGMAAVVKNLPVQDRLALLAGGPVGKIVEGTVGDNLKQTPEYKNARDPVQATNKERDEIMKLDAAEYGKLHTGLSAQGTTAAQMLPSIQLAKSLINSPDFYSGTGEGLNLAWKRAVAALGGDANAALPQEAFRKIMAANILHQVDDMKAAATEMGGTAGRIFQSQIDLMEKAAQNPDNSIQANKFLSELSERAARRNIAIADMADTYKEDHGRLSPAFSKQLRQWMQDNPMFTVEEMKNPALIAGPPPGAPAPSTVQGTGAGQAGGTGAPAAATMPAVGSIVNGFRFKGGDPNSKTSWEGVR
jgi:hypothetical protein